MNSFFSSIKKIIFYQLEKLKIKEELRSFNITQYSILKDLSVDVYENVILEHKKLSSLPFKFNTVHGNFTCSQNELVSLDGCPRSVFGNFECRNNKLTSLEHAPLYVRGSFICAKNKITSLMHSPEFIGGDFNCLQNELTSLKHCPNWIKGDFICTENKLINLAFAPLNVEGNFITTGEFTSLDDFKTNIEGNFSLEGSYFPQLDEYYDQYPNERLLSISGSHLKKFQDFTSFHEKLIEEVSCKTNTTKKHKL